MTFRRKFENVFKLYRKFYRKIIEIFVFEPHFRMADSNFAKEIEQKFGNPTIYIYVASMTDGATGRQVGNLVS